jgi:hypothetical protein
MNGAAAKMQMQSRCVMTASERQREHAAANPGGTYHVWVAPSWHELRRWSQIECNKILRVMPAAADLTSATTRVRRRLIPFLFLLYIVAYLDRINVGFAALQMNQALGFSARTYGFGAGLFFLSYVAFELSSFILARVGALVIARIMFRGGWYVGDDVRPQRHRFLRARFLLGLAEVNSSAHLLSDVLVSARGDEAAFATRRVAGLSAARFPRAAVAARTGTARWQ